MIDATNNCAVVAIAAITGETPEFIAAGLATFPDKDGKLAFTADDGHGVGVAWSSVESYLTARGWEQLFIMDGHSIPQTCMVLVFGSPCHCFAIVKGCIHDHVGGYDGAPIVSLIVPPAS